MIGTPKATIHLPGPYTRKLHNGTKVVVTDYTSHLYGEECEIKNHDPYDDTYLLMPYSKNYTSDWLGSHEFNVVGYPLPVAPLPVAPQPVQWKTQSSSNYGWDAGAEASLAGLPVFKMDRPRQCKHKWKVDYSSPFVKKEYFSCEFCPVKKEDYDKENEGMF